MMICSHQRNAVATALVLVLAAAATAMQPQLTLVSPWGLERGKTHEITLLGNRIKDAQELLFYSDGFQVDSLKAVDNKTCKVTVAVSPECRLGLHAVRLRTATGISSLCLFNVGAMAHVEEMEPNSDFAAPQAIPHNRTVAGVILAEDEDYFVLEAKKGQRISAELMGLRLGHTFFDPHLAILNEERFELAASDDTPFAYQDCVVALVAPEDGKYILRVRESSYGGDESSRYLLHVGEFLRPLAIYPAGGRPGERLAVRWLGDAAGPRDDTIPLPSDVRPDGVAQLFAQDDRSIAPTGNRIRLVDLPNVLEAEPNDARREATPATIPAALNGIIGQPGDTDHFRFSAKKGEKYHIRVFAREPVRSPLDAVINVFRANGGGRVGGNDDTGGPDAYLQFNPPADDDYFLRISDHLAAGGPGYVYRIEVSRRVPELSLSLPEKEQSKEVTLSVPRGNRMALMVSAKRGSPVWL